MSDITTSDFLYYWSRASLRQTAVPDGFLTNLPNIQLFFVSSHPLDHHQRRILTSLVLTSAVARTTTDARKQKWPVTIVACWTETPERLSNLSWTVSAHRLRFIHLSFSSEIFHHSAEFFPDKRFQRQGRVFRLRLIASNSHDTKVKHKWRTSFCGYGLLFDTRVIVWQ